MSLADARGAVPDLHVVEADDAADHALLEKVADWCDRYTPLVAIDPPHGLFLDISGCAHLFARAGEDGETALLSDCLHRLAEQGFEARGAVASTAGAAWALARYGGGGSIPAGGEPAAVAALPVAALRIAAADEALLQRLGLKRVGQLIGKPRAPLAARFGARLVDRLDQLLGHVDEVLSPRRPAPQFSAERRFAEPVVDHDSLLETVRSLARTLAPALERHAAGARLLEAAFFRLDGEVSRVRVGAAAPVRAADTVAMLLAERLAAIGSEWDAGFGYDMVRLSVLGAEPLGATQIDLAGEAGDAADLARLVDRLGARLGPSCVTRFLPVDTHIPERASHAEPLGQSTSPLPLRERVPLSLAKGAGEGGLRCWRGPLIRPSAYAEGHLLPQGEKGLQSLAETPPDRPLRLFARPEPVEVLAEVPEGPPLRFRWRRALHDVARAEGPERIAPEWWRPEDMDRATRDYYRVEDMDGRRYWLFRAGLYGRETARPVWYVHGLFA